MHAELHRSSIQSFFDYLKLCRNMNRVLVIRKEIATLILMLDVVELFFFVFFTARPLFIELLVYRCNCRQIGADNICMNRQTLFLLQGR